MINDTAVILLRDWLKRHQVRATPSETYPRQLVIQTNRGTTSIPLNHNYSFQTTTTSFF